MTQKNKRERAYKALAITWPSFLDDSYAAGLAAWLELSDTERREAARLAKTHIKTCKPCALGSYLKLHKWQGLEEITAPGGKVELRRYGKAWTIARLWYLRQGPGPVTGQHSTDIARWRVMYPMVSRLDSGASVFIDEKVAPAATVLDACISVMVGSADWAGWSAFHAAMDWPMIRPEEYVEAVWFPARNPRQWKHYDASAEVGE